MKGFAFTFAEAAAENGTAVIAAGDPRSAKADTYVRRIGGGLKKITVPGLDARSLAITGINDAGDTVGIGFTTGGQQRSFVGHVGHYKTLRLAIKNATASYAESINDHGTIVGSYADHHGVTHGFIDRHGRIQVVNLPGAGAKDGRGSQIQAISDNGAWVGDATTDASNADELDYVHLPGHQLARIEFPTAGKTTFALSIDDNDDIGGSYTSTDGRTIGFIARRQTPSQ